MATRPKTTRLTDDAAQINRPQTTTAGDAPADTFDPLERAVTSFAQNGSAALSNYQTVNAVVKSPTNAVWPSTPDATDTRSETYTQTSPTGAAFTVTHNIGNGTTTATAATAAAAATPAPAAAASTTTNTASSGSTASSGTASSGTPAAAAS